MNEELEQGLARTLIAFNGGLSDDDFATMMSEVDKTRSDRGHEDYAEFVDALFEDLSGRIAWADDGPDDQAVSDWIRDVCVGDDDEWGRIVAALEAAI